MAWCVVGAGSHPAWNAFSSSVILQVIYSLVLAIDGNERGTQSVSSAWTFRYWFASECM